MFVNDDLFFFLAIVTPVIHNSSDNETIKQLSSITASVQFACSIDYVSITQKSRAIINAKHH